MKTSTYTTITCFNCQQRMIVEKPVLLTKTICSCYKKPVRKGENK